MLRILFLSCLLCCTSVYAQQAGNAALADSRTPQNLEFKFTPAGDVHIFWDEPQESSDLSHYIIKRTMPDNPGTFVEIARLDSKREYTDRNVEPGDIVVYSVAAVHYSYPGIEWADYTGTLEVPKPITVTFTSQPPLGVRLGDVYVYEFELIQHPDYLVYFELRGAPQGVELRQTQNFRGIVWEPENEGVYEFTIVATASRYDAQTQDSLKYQTSQNVLVFVSENAGTIAGYVRGTGDQNLENSNVQLWYHRTPDEYVKFKVPTNEFGEFEMANAPYGTYYAYAHPGSDKFFAEYYENELQLPFANKIELNENNDDIYIQFVLPQNTNEKAWVFGTVRNTYGSSVEGAAVHFIRKNEFILIGDQESTDNPAVIESFDQTKIEQTVYSNYEGEFKAELQAGIDYYLVVEMDGYYVCFTPDIETHTNVLESKALRVGNKNPYLTYTLLPKENHTNTLTGTVRKTENGSPASATVVLIEEKLKSNRGVGGVGTYRRTRSVLTDSNGVYAFTNVPANEYVVLAIPMDRDVVPQYFSTIGRPTVLDESERINLRNTVQGIDFTLADAENTGLGCFYGRVKARDKEGNIRFLSGTLVYAVDKLKDKIVGYAVSDSSGWYSIPGLNPLRLYDAIADHPQYGIDDSLNIDVAYDGPTDDRRCQSVNFTIEVETLNTVNVIDPDYVPTQVTLYQNFPNPFNPSTTIQFGLNKHSDVELRVLNALGQEVMMLEKDEFEAGTHTVEFDASELPSGLYYYRLTAGTSVQTRTMMLVK